MRLKSTLLSILIVLVLVGSAFCATFTSKTTGNWNDGATWLQATISSLTVTVAVAGGNATFTRSAGDWTTNTQVGCIITFAGFSNGGNNTSFIATNVTALVVTAVQGTAIAEGPTAGVTASVSYISPGTKGTDWPGTAADVATIAAGHTVTYNVSETNALGTVTVNGTLYFSRSASTLLTMADGKLLTISATGYVDQGHSGDIIPSTYTSVISANSPSADGTTGIQLNAAGAKLTAFGDPAYYGSANHAFLAADWVITDGTQKTFYVTGDVTAAWATNAQLYVHKGTDYVSYISDINGAGTNNTTYYTISSMSYSAPNTAITINETPANGTFKAHGRVVNAARNVYWIKSNVNLNINQQNTNRFFINGNNLTSGTLTCSDMMVSGSTGFAQFFFPYTLTNVVVRNGTPAIDSSHYGTITNLTATSVNTILKTAHFNSINIGAAFCLGNVAITGVGNNVSGNVYAGNNTLTNVPSTMATGLNYFSNSNGLSAAKYVNCRIGYDENNNQMANYYDIAFDNSTGLPIYLQNCKIADIAAYGNINHINTTPDTFEHNYIYAAHFNQDAATSTYSDERTINPWANSKRVICGSGSPVPAQRSGGSTDCVQLSAMSNCSSVLFFKYPMARLWFITGTAKTYRFYVQTDYAANALTTAGFKLYATYMDSTGIIVSATPSTQDVHTRSDNTDWGQYVEVTVPSSAKTGWVDLYFQLMQYASAKYVWIDPKTVNP